MTASMTEDRCFEDRRAGGFEGLRIEWRTEGIDPATCHLELPPAT